MDVKRAAFERSADTQALVDFFTANAEPGKVFKYEELSRVIGTEVRDRYWCLKSAANAVLAELDLVLKPIRGVGIEVLVDSKIPKLGQEATEKQRRAARRTLRQLSAVRDYDSLSPAEKESLTVHRSVLKLMVMAGRAQVIERIRAIAGAQKSIPVAKLMEAIKGTKVG